MDLKIEELQALISAQKAISGVSHFGAFKDGFIAAWDILNTYLKLKEPKCKVCLTELSDDEIADGDKICHRCY